MRILERFSIPDDIIRLSTDTIYYGFGKSAEALATLALVPVLTRAFTPTQFGLWDVTLTFFLLTCTLASFGLEAALAAFYFESQDSDKREVVASTSIRFRLLSSILVAAPIFAFAPQISQIIFNTPEHAVYFRIVAGILPFFLAVNIFKQLLRLDFSPGKFNLVGAGYAALYAALGIFFVVKMKMEVSGVLLGMLASAFCFSIVGAVFTARHFSLGFSGKVLKDMLRFGLPLLPAILACWVIDFSDRYFLAKLSTLEEVGIYSVGARISSIIILFSTSFQMAWGPFALSIQHEGDAKAKYSRGLFLFLGPALAGAAAIAIFARPILVVLAQPKYYEAERVIGLLVLGTVAFGAYLIVNIGLLITKKTILTSLAISAGAVLNIALNFLLIPAFGMMGAAVATLASYFTAFVLIYMFAQKHYPVDYRPARIAGMVLLSILAIALSSAVRFDSALVDLLFRIMLVVGLLYFLLRASVLRTDEH